MLNGVDIDISVSSSDLTDKVANRPALQRANQIAASECSSNNAVSYGNSEFGRTEQKGDYRTVDASPSKVNMGCGDTVYIADDKPERQPVSGAVQRQHGISGSDSAHGRHFISAI